MILSNSSNIAMSSTLYPIYESPAVSKNQAEMQRLYSDSGASTSSSSHNDEKREYWPSAAGTAARWRNITSIHVVPRTMLVRVSLGLAVVLLLVITLKQQTQLDLQDIAVHWKASSSAETPLCEDPYASPGCTPIFL